MITLRRLGSVLMLASLATATGSAASASRPARSEPRNASDRVVVRGKALLDGRPFDSRWVGAIVLKSGLATPCQSTLPHVRHGRYAVTVLADTESSGCGAPGAQIVLWTFAHETTVYSTNTVAWPVKKHIKNFVPRFSSHGAGGAAPELAEFTGAVFGADGRELEPGTRVDAYVDGTRCGVASVRRSRDFAGYILAVVGPESIRECTRGSALTFSINGHPAAPTNAVNTPPGQRDSLNLTLEGLEPPSG